MRLYSFHPDDRQAVTCWVCCRLPASNHDLAASAANWRSAAASLTSDGTKLSLPEERSDCRPLTAPGQSAGLRAESARKPHRRTDDGPRSASGPALIHPDSD